MSRSAFITGANRGIGRAIALRLAAKGYNLFLLARNEVALTSVVAECQAVSKDQPIDVLSFAGELTDEAYVDAAITAAIDAQGAIDVLVNNAGIAQHQAVQNADIGAWRDLFDVNFHAVVYLCRQILPAMIERRSGAVINISSISGRNTSAGSGAYSASKHALNGFTECMYEDVREHGIKVSAIMPGFVATELTGGMGMNSGNMIRPDDVADAVQYVLMASANCCPTEIVLRPQLRP